MNFAEIANTRQSCRKYTDKPVEEEKLIAVLEAARLAPSACNGQPYHFTVCKGQKAKEAAKLVITLGYGCDPARKKIRKDLHTLVTILDD